MFIARPLGRAVGVLSERIWLRVGPTFIDFVRKYRLDVATFRALVDSTARPMVARLYGPEGNAVLDQIWTRAEGRWATVPRQSSFGATLTVRLAAITAAAYEAFIANGATAEEATLSVCDIAWAVYEKMGNAAWASSALFSKDNSNRMRVATIAFRIFPFSVPSYEWNDVESPPDVVAFDCQRCPVAEYFKTQHLSELCVQTWCALDFPLAENVWHAKLERSGSIAAGASHCDFRWHPHVSSDKARPNGGTPANEPHVKSLPT